MENISDRIALFAKEKGLSIRAIEQQIGCSNGVLARCVSKGTDISSSWVSKIVETFKDLSPNWLLVGEGPMFRSSPQASSSQEAPTAPTDPYIYRLLERKDEENKALIRENGRLEERISNLEAELKEYKKYEDYTYEDFDMYKEMVAEPASTEKSSSHKLRRATYATAHYGSDDMGFEEVK